MRLQGDELEGLELDSVLREDLAEASSRPNSLGLAGYATTPMTRKRVCQEPDSDDDDLPEAHA